MFIIRETEKVIIISKSWKTCLLSWSIIICAGCFLWNFFAGHKDYSHDIHDIDLIIIKMNDDIYKMNKKINYIYSEESYEIK